MTLQLTREEPPQAGPEQPEPKRSWLTRKLERANSFAFVAFGGLAAFCVYFSMYAFRKPYAAGTYEVVDGWNIEFGFKELLVISQILGYALSKVIGIKVISEMRPSRRAPPILLLIGVSLLGLVLFAILPVQIKFLGLFLNGLPLGMIWGLVFGYLEGRRTTEILGAILSASFIVSSGIVKSIAVAFMNAGISEFWMPAATGAIFLPILFISVYALSQLPAPSKADVEARTERKPMNAQQRRAFLGRYLPGIALLVFGYILLTVFRDFRDDFAVEIWAGLGFKDDPGVLTQSEIPVAIVTLLVFAGLVLIKDNLRAFLTIQVMSLVGALMMGLSALGFVAGVVSPLWLMIGTGAGLYIGYMPFGAMLFERMIAATKTVANAGFLIYVADASGYLGTVVLLIYKNLFAPDLDWLSVFIIGAFVTSIVCLVFFVFAMGYFAKKLVQPRVALSPAAATA
ncbi:MAG: DUF5690 family protein [Leucobacter sp.]